MKVLITKNKQYVKVDKYDTWSMDITLAHIVVPMLKQLRDSTHSAPKITFEDRPEHLIGTEPEDWTNDEHHFEAWDWVLSEMLFAFESKLDDRWQDGFYDGEHDWVVEESEDGLTKMIHGENHTWKADMEGLQVVQNRITNGFRLFGKYYENLWD